MKSKLTGKIHRVSRDRNGQQTRNHPARIVSERKQTNFELLRDALLKRGHVKLRTAFQIGLADGNYGGARGGSLVFLASTVEAAEQFLSDVAETLPQIAQAAGLVLLSPPKQTTKERKSP